MLKEHPRAKHRKTLFKKKKRGGGGVGGAILLFSSQEVTAEGKAL